MRRGIGTTRCAGSTLRPTGATPCTSRWIFPTGGRGHLARLRPTSGSIMTSTQSGNYRTTVDAERMTSYGAQSGHSVQPSGEPPMQRNVKILRRTAMWMFVAVLAIGSAFAFEHDTSSRGVMLDTLTLAKNDGSCEHDHQGPNSKPNCVPCTDEHGKTKGCKQPCTHGPNEDPKNN